MEELRHMLLLALHAGVPQVFIAFATSPEHIVLGPQALADLKAMLELACRIRIDISERRGRSAGDEARVGEQRRGVPQQFDTGGLHILFDFVDYLVQVRVGFTKSVTFWSDVTIVEAEVFDTQLLEQFECIIDRCQSAIHRIGVLVIWTMSGRVPERIHQSLLEGVPPSDAETQPILHFLAGDDTVLIVIMESKTFLRPFFAADIFDLVYIPQTHWLLLCWNRAVLMREAVPSQHHPW